MKPKTRGTETCGKVLVIIGAVLIAVCVVVCAVLLVLFLACAFGLW